MPLLTPRALVPATGREEGAKRLCALPRPPSEHLTLHRRRSSRCAPILPPGLVVTILTPPGPCRSSSLPISLVLAGYQVSCPRSIDLITRAEISGSRRQSRRCCRYRRAAVRRTMPLALPLMHSGEGWQSNGAQRRIEREAERTCMSATEKDRGVCPCPCESETDCVAFSVNSDYAIEKSYPSGT